MEKKNKKRNRQEQKVKEKLTKVCHWKATTGHHSQIKILSNNMQFKFYI